MNIVKNFKFSLLLALKAGTLLKIEREPILLILIDHKGPTFIIQLNA